MEFANTTKLINDESKRISLPYLYCVVKKDGKEIFNYRYDESNTNNDLLDFYSMSKPITVIALLQLVEQGLVDVNDEVSKYLPGYKDLYLMSGEKVNSPVTIKHLLTMTSGLDYNLGRKAVQDLVKANPNANTIDVCNVLGKDGLLFVPGTSYQYSLSIDVAAAIVELVSKERFSTYVENHIFKPLGMDNSTFKYNLELSRTTKEEYAYEGNKPVIAKKYYKGFHATDNYESGGAGLISKAEDYSKFIDSIATRSNKIIKDETVNLMNQLYVIETPFNDKTSDYSKNRDDYGYGFGVRVRKVESKYGIPAGEFGWDGAVGSYCLCDRDNKISIVIGLSIQNWPAVIPNLHLDIANMVYKDIFNK